MVTDQQRGAAILLSIMMGILLVCFADIKVVLGLSIIAFIIGAIIDNVDTGTTLSVFIISPMIATYIVGKVPSVTIFSLGLIFGLVDSFVND